MVAPASHVAWMAVTSCAGGGRQQRHVVAGPRPPGPAARRRSPWPRSCSSAPGDDVLATADDERDGGVALGGALEAAEE